MHSFSILDWILFLVYKIIEYYLCSTVLILCATFMREISLEVTGILPNLLTSLSGGTPLVVTGMYSYLTVCTSEKNRTFRFACAAVVIATIPIGANFFSGFLFKSLGFVSEFRSKEGTFGFHLVIIHIIFRALFAMHRDGFHWTHVRIVCPKGAY